ncbi:MAG: hypothetical protein M3M96_09450 [Candidatus Eremiobacteraeota bacterium]|nr:hypothetical protein [Candidatus Eremiobacteraeota bacterium]
MNFLFKWLRVRATQHVTLHPTRTLDVALPFEEAFHRCTHGIESVLGGAVRDADAGGGRIEATFGLMFSERLTCSLERLSTGGTRVRVESRRGAVGEVKEQSDYVDRLADWLSTQ